MLIHKNIVYTASSVASPAGGMWSEDSLRWFSRGASVGGANVKLCICAVWGNNGRPVVSVGISTLSTTSLHGETARGRAQWSNRSGVVGCPLGSEVVCVDGGEPMAAMRDSGPESAVR